MLAQPIKLHLTPFNNRRPALSTADDRTNRRQQQLIKLVGALTATRIAQFFECFQQGYRCVCHLVVQIAKVNAFLVQFTSTSFPLWTTSGLLLHAIALPNVYN